MYQRRGYSILVSQNFDGELITRVARRLGFHVFRGSSSRNGLGALREMVSALQSGIPVALTVDGPRGPRFKAKAGAVALARETGFPLYAFHIAPDRFWQLRSWDGFKIPKPGARLYLAWRGPIEVSPGSSAAQLEECRQQLESLLEQARLEAERWAGSNTFKETSA